MDDSVLQEVADLLDMGFVVFVHKRTFEVLSYPHPDRWGELEAIDEYEAIRSRIEEAAGDFIEIALPSAKDAFRMMQDFANQVQDERLRTRLLEALRSPKPFRYFRHMVESSDEAEAWTAYRLARIKEYAIGRLAEAWD